MNKIIIALIGLALIASPALAHTLPTYADSQFSLSATGITYVADQSILYNKASNTQNVFDLGTINMGSSTEIKGSSMVESTDAWTTGISTTSTEDDWGTGLADAYAGLTTYTSGGVPITYVGKEVINLGSGSMIYSTQTDSIGHFVESFGYNKPTDCTPTPPKVPTPPTCTFCTHID